jgi:hypothetical protein
MTRLFWDFFGPAAEKLASHQLEHLAQFLGREQRHAHASGVESRGALHSAAWVDLDDADAEPVAATLRVKRREAR